MLTLHELEQTHGIHVDARIIAEALYRMICEKEEEALVAFGMIPMWVMEILQKNVRQKILEDNARRIGCSTEDMKPHIDEVVLMEIVNSIVWAVATEIYGVAKNAGKMIV